MNKSSRFKNPPKASSSKFSAPPKGVFVPNRISVIILSIAIILSVVKIAIAATPDPGHNFTSASGGVAQGDIFYGSAADTLAALAKNSSSTRYLSNTGAGNNPAWAQVDVTNGVTGTLPVANGGIGLAALADKNVILGAGTAVPTFVAPGSSGNILTSNGTTWLSSAPSAGNDNRITMDALGTGEQFDVTANTTVMENAANLDQALAAGTYTFKYHVIWRTDDATNGIRLAVNYTGTSGSFVWRWSWTDISAAASTAVPDQDAIIAAGQVTGAHASRIKSSTTRGALLSADTVNADMMAIIEGVFVATGSGDLELWAGNETAGVGDNVSLMIGTGVEIHKIK